MGNLSRAAALSSIVVVLLAATVASADSARIVGESRRAAQRIAEAVRLAQSGRAAAAVDLYLRIVDENGSELVAANETGSPLWPARWIVHRQIAAEPVLLPIFRERVDTTAAKLLEAGVAARDPRPLERLVESMFCARSAETALHLLGDLACERGDFSLAQHFWGLLIPGDSAALAYPDSAAGAALPRAKIILARLLAGNRDGLEAEIAAIDRDFPDAVIQLAGRSGRVADVLRQLAADGTLAVTKSPRIRTGVTSFGGDHSRNGVLPVPLPDRWLRPPFDEFVLPEAAPIVDGTIIQKTQVRSTALAFWPLVVGDHALVADARRLTAYELGTGAIAAQFDLKAIVGSLPQFDSRLPSASNVRHTLTAEGDRLYLRLGQPQIRSDRIQADSYLAAVKFTPAAHEKLQLCWLLPAIKADQPIVAIFEGTPIIRDGRLYAAMTRIDGNRATTSVACFDPGVSEPQLLWQEDVFETGSEAAERTRHLFLTAAGSHIVCGPIAGAIVALDARTGRRAWASRYAPQLPDVPLDDFAGLQPGLAIEGRVFAAPADYDRVIALDASNGDRLWESDSIEVAHLLGVADGKLFVQTSGFTAGLAAFDVETGRRLANWGYSVFGSDPAAPFGRGLVFSDCVCWPTRTEGVKTLRFDGAPGVLPALFHAAPAGNLVFADGVLLVATADRMHLIRAATSPARSDP